VNWGFIVFMIIGVWLYCLLTDTWPWPFDD